MKKIVVADHSGPSFTFEGLVSPEFIQEFLSWMRAQTKEEVGPESVEISKDCASADVSYEWGNTYLKISEENGRFSAYLHGDAEEVEFPESRLFKRASYSDDDGGMSVIVDGEEYGTKEIMEIVAQAKSKQTSAQTAP
jgi:hypothetical protein